MTSTHLYSSVSFQSATALAGEPAAPETMQADAPDTLTITADEWKRLPRTRMQVKGKTAEEIAFQGVLLSEVLKLAGIRFGDKQALNQQLLMCVVVEAADGFKALFALSEFEPALANRTALLADTAAGQPFDARDGAIRLIVPGENLRARWVRQVRSLKVFRLPGVQPETALRH